MSLLDQARDLTKATGPNRCAVSEAIDQRPDLEGEIIELLADRSVTHTAAARAFLANDITINRSTVERHRNNICLVCEKAGRRYVAA